MTGSQEKKKKYMYIYRGKRIRLVQNPEGLLHKTIYMLNIPLDQCVKAKERTRICQVNTVIMNCNESLAQSNCG